MRTKQVLFYVSEKYM